MCTKEQMIKCRLGVPVQVFGTGVGSQFILSHGKMATAVSDSATWGIGVMMGIFVSGGVSGEWCVR